MKTYRIIIKLTLIFILISFYALSSECRPVSFSNNMCAESLGQGLRSALQSISVVIEEDELENETPDVDLAVDSRINIFNLNNLKMHMLLEKAVSLIQISFHGYSPRSPTFNQI